MKNILTLAIVLTLTATTTFAGSLNDPVVEAPVENSTSTSASVLLPLALLAILVAAVSE